MVMFIVFRNRQYKKKKEKNITPQNFITQTYPRLHQLHFKKDITVSIVL